MNIKKRSNDAYDSRCGGLVPGTALKSDFKTAIHASFATKKQGPFYCSECLSEAIVKKCSDKEDHFAHHAKKSPTALKGNTKFHHGVRDELLTVLKEAFPDGDWKTEVSIKSKNGNSKIVADIAGYFGKRDKNKAVAVEVQCSPYSPSYIQKKTSLYFELDVNVLWVVPLVKELGIDIFRPRRYELYLHSMYLGYVFYYIQGENGVLTAVHYSPAFRYIDENTYFNTDGQEVTNGGYYLKYKTLKEPSFSTISPNISSLISKNLKAWEHPTNKKLSVGDRKIMALNTPKWWPNDESKEWLKNNDLPRYVNEYKNDNYTYDDETDYFPDDDQ